MNFEIEVDQKICKRTCPYCGREKVLEWVAGKTDKSMQQYICRNCRMYVEITGMTSQDQDIIDQEAWM